MISETENKTKLESFFKKEYHILKAYVRSKIRASTDLEAEDIVQDVALKLFTGAERYSPINNVPGFVYHSIRNKIIDSMRKGNKNVQLEDENEMTLIEFTEVFSGQAANAYSEDMMNELSQTIQKLKEPYRDIIIAVDLEGYSYKEISEETGIPEGTLMSRRHRAIAQLNKELEKQKINE